MAIDITRYFELVRGGEPQRLQSLFSENEVLVEDPRAGRVADDAALDEYVSGQPAWLGNSLAEVVAVTRVPGRTVAEFVIHLERKGGTVPLPVALAADQDDGALAAVRLYYSMWPLRGHHTVRPPLLPEDDNIVMPDVVGLYHDALTKGDLEAILAVFEEDGYAREPAGGSFVYRGQDRLKEFYGALFGNGGGILLEHCTLTDDSTRVALEYNAVAWGRTGLDPQAGIAVYERGKTGPLRAARIYDDVEPPL